MVYFCREYIPSKKITWVEQPLYNSLLKTPGQIRLEIALETARYIDLAKLDNSLFRVMKGKQNIYSQLQLNEFTVKLGGTVRGNKEKIINFIRDRVVELTQNLNSEDPEEQNRQNGN